MLKTTEEIEKYLNDFLVKYNATPNCILDNLFLFYLIAKEVSEVLESDFKDGVFFDKSQFTKVTLTEKIKIVKQFYQDSGIEFDIEKYVEDGTIEFIDYNQLNEDFDYFCIYNCFRGTMYRHNGKKLVDVCENGLVTDIPILIHEISHFRDEPESERNQISDLLTEALAYAEVFISADYLDRLGFKIDANIIFEDEYNSLYEIAKSLKSLLKMYLVFMEIGDIEEESYKYFFDSTEENSSDYQENLDFIKRNYNWNIQHGIWHLLGLYLAPYMFEKYNSNNNYMKNIVQLHEEINTSDFLTCLNIIGLNDLSKIDREEIMKSIINIKTDYLKTQSKSI